MTTRMKLASFTETEKLRNENGSGFSLAATVGGRRGYYDGNHGASEISISRKKKKTEKRNFIFFLSLSGEERKRRKEGIE